MAEEKKQKRLFKKKRGGIVLTENEVREIKAGRKKLRKEMKKMGIRSRKEFELTASSMGLYFDKNRWWALLLWFFHGGRWLRWLLAALAAFLFALFCWSMVTEHQGHFTINLDDDMLKNGFVLSETEDFANPQIELDSDPVENVPCISIVALPEDIEDYEGTHTDGTYFAYTFWLRNEGEDTVDYTYDIRINSESQDLSTATWIMFFENGEMTFHAEESLDGGEEAIPSFGDNSQGYRYTPFREQAKYPDEQYQVVASTGRSTYYRAVPIPFESESIAVTGYFDDIEPRQVNKYTVVMWLEGDDPDCTDALIGGHLGLDMQFALVPNEKEMEEDLSFIANLRRLLEEIRENLKFLDPRPGEE